jgi:hypothetical protein
MVAESRSWIQFLSTIYFLSLHIIIHTYLIVRRSENIIGP